MKCVKNIHIENKAIPMLACALGLAFVVSGCSSSSSPAATTTTPATVSVSGTVTTETTTLEPDVTVTGKYSDTDVTAPAITNASGVYTLPTISTSKAVWLQFAKTGLATLNSEKSVLTTNITDADVDMPTAVQAQLLIDVLFGANTTLLGNVAWLVADVEDANGNNLDGASISSTPAPDFEVYVDCGDINLGATATVAPCNPEQSVMYIAYYSSGLPVDASVSAVGDTLTAPLRQGEITFVDFEQ